MCNWLWKKIKAQRNYLIGATNVFCLATNYLFLDAQNVSSEFFCLSGFCFQAALLSVVASLRCRRSDFTVSLRSELSLHLARSLTGCGAFFFILKAAEMVDLDDIMNVMACVPALMAILSRLFLGEKLNFSELTANAAAIGGVVSVGRPSALFENEDDNGDEVIGSIWASLGCICLALTYVLQRKIRRTRLEVTLLFNAAVALTVLIPVTVTMDRQVPDCVDVLSALVSGAFVVITLFFHVEVSRLRGTEQLKMLCAVHLPFTVVTEILEFDELPWFACYVGASVVGFCVLALWFLQDGGDGGKDSLSLKHADPENSEGKDVDSIERHGDSSNRNMNGGKEVKEENGDGKEANLKNSTRKATNRKKYDDKEAKQKNSDGKDTNRQKYDSKETKPRNSDGKEGNRKKSDKKDVVQEKLCKSQYAESRKYSKQSGDPEPATDFPLRGGGNGDMWKASSEHKLITRADVERVPESWTNYDPRTVERETFV